MLEEARTRIRVAWRILRRGLPETPEGAIVTRLHGGRFDDLRELTLTVPLGDRRCDSIAWESWRGLLRGRAIMLDDLDFSREAYFAHALTAVRLRFVPWTPESES